MVDAKQPSVSVKPVKPAVKEVQKKQPYYAWRCTFLVGKRKKKKCNFSIGGPHKGPVEHSSDQHWENHLGG